MGINDRGQVGDGTSENAHTPKEIVSSNVTAIAVGRWHSLLLKSNGSLWGIGDNGWGQLGADALGGANRPIEIVSNGVASIAPDIITVCFSSLTAACGRWEIIVQAS